MQIQLVAVLCLVFVGNARSGLDNCLEAVGKKQYCPDHNEMRTWREAREFCEINDMNLATIVGMEQYDFLKAAYNDTRFYGDYWIGARETQTLLQFVWQLPSGATAILDPRYLELVDASETLDYLTCIVFTSRENLDSNLKLLPCNIRTVTLCEKQVS